MANAANRKMPKATIQKLDKILDGAANLHISGQINKAKDLYAKILEKFPNHPGTLRLLAILDTQVNEAPEKAIALLQQAIATDPKFGLAYKLLGALLVKAGRHEDAIEHLEKALKLNTDDYDSGLELAGCFAKIKREEDAIGQYRRLLTLRPHDMRGYLAIGKTLSDRNHGNDMVEAKEALLKADELSNDHPEVAFFIGIIFSDAHQFDDAIPYLQKALETHSDPKKMADAAYTLANIQRDKKELQQAVDLYSRAIELNPEHHGAYTNLGNFLDQQGFLEESMACARKTIELAPNSAAGYSNLGSMLITACRPEESLEVLQSAVRLKIEDQNILWNFALCLLAVGRIEEGWDLYDAGFLSEQRQPHRPFPGIIWEGEDLTGKTIMISREQGIGDDLRFSTCIQDIVDEAKHVVIETDKRLVALYKRTWPQATVRVDSHRSTGRGDYPKSEIDFDLTAPTGKIASLRRRSVHDFPRECRPLIAAPEKRQEAREWLDSLGSGPKIGLTWRSGIRNPVRNLVASEIKDWACLLADIEGAQIINLQFGKPEEEILEAAKEHGITVHQMPDLDVHNDLDGSAALTAELDMVTGLWNAASEMAGAVGTPGVIYMPAHHNMQLGTGILPWHPSLRTYSVIPGFDRAELAKAMTRDMRILLRLDD